jgi:hypothetical protein
MTGRDKRCADRLRFLAHTDEHVATDLELDGFGWLADALRESAADRRLAATRLDGPDARTGRPQLRLVPQPDQQTPKGVAAQPRSRRAVSNGRPAEKSCASRFRARTGALTSGGN